MDNNNVNFSHLWQSQPTPQISSTDLQKSANNFKKSMYKKIIFITLAFVLTLFLICWIWIAYTPQLWTTKLGIVLTILSMTIFWFSINRQYPIIKKIDAAQTNTDYLNNLLLLKKKQQFLQTTMLSLYFVLLSLGIFLYIIEAVSYMPKFWGVFAYGITTAWILSNWFYLRPKQIKKQQTEMNEIISKFEGLQAQLAQE